MINSMIRLSRSNAYEAGRIEKVNIAYKALQILDPDHKLLRLSTPCVGNLGIKPDRRAFVAKYRRGAILTSGESFDFVLDNLHKYEADLNAAIKRKAPKENGGVTKTPNLATLVRRSPTPSFTEKPERNPPSVIIEEPELDLPSLLTEEPEIDDGDYS